VSDRRVRSVLAIPVLLGSFALSAGPAQAATCGGDATSLTNGGFETELVGEESFAFVAEADLAPWRTTGGDIEIWGTGHEGVPSSEGANFAEINAHDLGTLYQDVVTTPGATMTWTLQHRGRGGDETMRVLIGDAATADVYGDTGWDYTSADLTDGVEAWGEHSDSYVVPEGQTCTRFAFRAIDWVVAPSYGNFLDAISFEITTPAVTSPAPATPAPTGALGSAPNSAETPGAGIAVVAALLAGAALAMAIARPTRGSRRRS
jgi:hypothetical protein